MAGLLTILAAYFVGRRLFGYAVGLLSALVLALNPQHIQMSLEIRMYSLVVLFATLSVLAFISYIRSRRSFALVVNALINALLLWTHPVGALMYVVEGLFVLRQFREQPHSRAPLTVWGIAHLALGVSAVLWFFARFEHGESGLNWIGPVQLLGVRDPASIFFGYTSAGGGSLHWAVPHIPFVWAARGKAALDYAVFALVAAAMVTGCVQWGQACLGTKRTDAPRLEPRRCFEWSFLLVWAILPTILLALVSVCWRPALTFRYLAFIWPAVALVAGAAFFGTRMRALRSCAYPLVAVLALQNVTMLWAPPIRPTWEEVAALVTGDEPVLVHKYHVA
jgi:uncharacterized membrane protein